MKLVSSLPDPASKLTFCSALHFGVTCRDIAATCSVCFGRVCVFPLSKSGGGIFVARFRCQIRPLLIGFQHVLSPFL